jgi:hypothetical protein
LPTFFCWSVYCHHGTMELPLGSSTSSKLLPLLSAFPNLSPC